MEYSRQAGLAFKYFLTSDSELGVQSFIINSTSYPLEFNSRDLHVKEDCDTLPVCEMIFLHPFSAESNPLPKPRYLSSTKLQKLHKKTDKMQNISSAHLSE